MLRAGPANCSDACVLRTFSQLTEVCGWLIDCSTDRDVKADFIRQPIRRYTQTPFSSERQRTRPPPPRAQGFALLQHLPAPAVPIDNYKLPGRGAKLVIIKDITAEEQSKTRTLGRPTIAGRTRVGLWSHAVFSGYISEPRLAITLAGPPRILPKPPNARWNSQSILLVLLRIMLRRSSIRLIHHRKRGSKVATLSDLRSLQVEDHRQRHKAEAQETEESTGPYSKSDQRLHPLLEVWLLTVLTLHAHAFDHVRSEKGEDGALVVTN